MGAQDHGPKTVSSPFHLVKVWRLVATLAAEYDGR
jgi:hypothetical protein